ncbi:MAG: zinc-binding dehydrogenase [Acidobacteriota bacterium]
MEWMSAAVLHGRRDLRIEKVPLPEVGCGEALIRVERALTCGTDLKVYKRGSHARMLTPPALFGHEMAGVVEKVGSGVDGFARGMRVVTANSAPCLECFFCRKEQPNLCENLVFVNGSYAQYLLAPSALVKTNMLKIPAGVSFQDAAFTEPLACVLKGLEEARVQSHDRVLVIGLGPVGILFIRLCARAGATVLAVGKRPQQLVKARGAGADAAFLFSRPDLVWAIRDATPRQLGVDVAIEAVGNLETWRLAFDSVRRGGRIQLFGGCRAGSKIALDTQRLHYCQISITSSFHHTPRHIREALRLISEDPGVVQGLCTARATLRELPRVFEEMLHRNGELKTIVLPHS